MFVRLSAPYLSLTFILPHPLPLHSFLFSRQCYNNVDTLSLFYLT